MEPKQIILEEISSGVLYDRAQEKWNTGSLDNTVFMTAKAVSFSESIGKIVSGRFFTLENTPLTELVDIITEKPEIQAVGIIRRNGTVKGVIIRRLLMSLFSKAFGREILSRETVSTYLDQYGENIPEFDFQDNIFDVSDRIKDYLNNNDENFFLITRRERYYGVFNSRDILIYLAAITRNDFALSKRIQSRIVKEKEMNITEDFAYSAVSVMAMDVGGDFYTVRKLDKGTYLIALCDVSGKGMAASLISSLLYGFINSYDCSRGLVRFAEDLNSHLFSSFAGDKFITGVFAVFDENTGDLVLLDMGHSHYWYSGNRQKPEDPPGKTNMPLGVTERIKIETTSIRLKRGERFFITTDGLLEQNSYEGETYRLRIASSIIAGNRKKDVNEVTALILEDFNRFRDGVVLHDDVTFILFEYPETAASHVNRTRTISDNIHSQIEWSVNAGKPLQIKTSRYYPKTRNFIEEILASYLEIPGHSEYQNNVAYCIHELATNAKKANLKRLYFREKNLDIKNPVDYEKGMISFRSYTEKNIDRCVERLKELGYYIVVSFMLTAGSLTVEVINNSELVEQESSRIRSKFNAASACDNIASIYSTIADDTEGAGLGIVMMKHLLKNTGNGENTLTISSRRGITSAKIHLQF